MNITLLIVCMGLGIAAYHGVVTILDLVIKDEPKRVSPRQRHASDLAKDIYQTKQLMNKAASRYHRLRGTV
ncbi:hypothetical protein [Pseudarthrobacter sp. ATCC 49987]|uniref:hypothetical protein n=1 Tax=Pseudarthrobacter sp. ATCC 49987 TaxID=2698204 RepID=UPI0013681395|nr:hypothetical protein [Pseudarthrobacter sp. ATCC 49987]